MPLSEGGVVLLRRSHFFADRKKRPRASNSPPRITHHVLAFADIDILGMDVNGPSSNWKKLQATLKKGSTSTLAPASKRKASDRDSGRGTAKKRKSEKQLSKPYDSKTPLKRKRMSDGTEVVAKIADANPASTTLRRKSSTGVSAPSPVDTRNGKVNEGRSPT